MMRSVSHGLEQLTTPSWTKMPGLGLGNLEQQETMLQLGALETDYSTRHSVEASTNTYLSTLAP